MNNDPFQELLERVRGMAFELYQHKIKTYVKSMWKTCHLLDFLTVFADIINSKPAGPLLKSTLSLGGSFFLYGGLA
jgi:hypothetical protein